MTWGSSCSAPDRRKRHTSRQRPGAAVRPADSSSRLGGKVTQVQTDQEAEYFEESRDAYLKQTKFTENTDLKDLDRLLVLELMVFRWTQHLSAGSDYDGDMVNEKQLTADIKLYSDQINKIK